MERGSCKAGLELGLVTTRVEDGTLGEEAEGGLGWRTGKKMEERADSAAGSESFKKEDV
jgi:hypothetical protein